MSDHKGKEAQSTYYKYLSRVGGCKGDIILSVLSYVNSQRTARGEEC